MGKNCPYLAKNARFGPNLVQNMHFWSFEPKIGIFSLFCPTSDQKKNANKVPRWFFRYVGTKTFLPPGKIRIFRSKTAKFNPKLKFLAHLVWWPPKINANKVPRWFFRYMGTKTFIYSRKNLFFLAQKQPNLALIMHL